MARHSTEISLPARYNALPDLLDQATKLAESAGRSPQDGLRLQLVLEELFTNTIEHGHQGECDARVSVRIDIDAPTLHLEYRDTAPPFNPENLPEFTGSTAGIGGVGLELVRQMTRNLVYRYEDGCNVLEFDF
jgi:anti-sigma regulatory factor (Ser/Thr protein kinase)